MRLLSSTFLLFAGAMVLSAQESGGVPEVNVGWKWANFIILVAGLGYLVAKTLPPLFKSRTEEIQKGIAEAREMKQDADRRSADVAARTATAAALANTTKNQRANNPPSCSCPNATPLFSA